MTYQDAQRYARQHGYKLTRTPYDHEYRLAPCIADRAKAERQAYYTDDLDDALGTLNIQLRRAA